jgi:hypothetical protein
MSQSHHGATPVLEYTDPFGGIPIHNSPFTLHQTITRPLPPLPAHLSRLGSNPPSPDGMPVSSSTGSTPTGLQSPRITADSRKRDRERGRQLEREPASRGSSATGDKLKRTTSALTDAGNGVSEEKRTKKVKVGARASIACATCRSVLSSLHKIVRSDTDIVVCVSAGNAK